MCAARLLLLVACGTLANRPDVHTAKMFAAQRILDPTSLPQWQDATWKEQCWGMPGHEQDVSGEVLQSICARLHHNASFLVFGFGPDSGLWLQNAIGKLVFLENHEEWLQLQEKGVADVTRILKYDSDLSVVGERLYSEDKLASLYESLPKDVREAHWDMVLVDSPMGTGTGSLPAWMNMLGARHLSQVHPIRGHQGCAQSIYAASRLAQRGTLVYVNDDRRSVGNNYPLALLEPLYRTLRVFSSRQGDNGILAKTALLVHEPEDLVHEL